MTINIYSYSTTPASNSDLDGATMAEGMSADKLNDGVREFAADVAGFVKDIAGGVVAGGTANAITVTANCGFSAYANGLVIAFKAAHDNTAATTLNVNSIGTKSVRQMTSSGDAALSGGEIQEDGIYVAHYSTDANSGSGGWILVNPTVPVHGTWTPTLTSISNVAATTAYLCYYTRTYDRVSCRGILEVDPTLAAPTSTVLDISLPIASNFTSEPQLTGLAINRNNPPGQIAGNTTDDRARLLFQAESLANASWSFQFDYVIL